MVRLGCGCAVACVLLVGEGYSLSELNLSLNLKGCNLSLLLFKPCVQQTCVIVVISQCSVLLIFQFSAYG